MKENILMTLMTIGVFGSFLAVHSLDYDYELAKYEMAAIDNSTDSKIYKEDNMNLKETAIEFGQAIIKINRQLNKFSNPALNPEFDYTVLVGGSIVIGVDNISKFDIVMLVDEFVRNGYDASIIDYLMLDDELAECDMQSLPWSKKYNDILLLKYNS